MDAGGLQGLGGALGGTVEVGHDRLDVVVVLREGVSDRACCASDVVGLVVNRLEPVDAGAGRGDVGFLGVHESVERRHGGSDVDPEHVALAPEGLGHELGGQLGPFVDQALVDVGVEGVKLLREVIGLVEVTAL